MEKGGFTPIETPSTGNTIHKKRPSIFVLGKDTFGNLKAHFDRSLLLFHLFYFFFYAAFGSLFPLISIYFKQLGLSAIQCGTVSGLRSVVECLAHPFWNSLAEKWKKGKSFLIVSLMCSMSFTLGLGFVRPKPEGCLVRFAQYESYNRTANEKIDAGLTLVEPYRTAKYGEFKSADMTRELAMKIKNEIGQSPLYLNTQLLSDPSKFGTETYAPYYQIAALSDPTQYPPGSLVMPLYSTVVYSQTKINQMFMVILLLVLFGELLSCPAIPLVDALVAQKTQMQPTSLHGQQRISGSIGWSLAMFFIGVALDNASLFPDYPCLHPGYRERNYMVCFATYSVFIAFALFTSTQFSFIYEGDQESMYFKLAKDKMARTFLGRTTKNRSKLVNEEDPDEASWTVQLQTAMTDESLTGDTEGNPTNEEILERQLGIKLGSSEANKPKEKKTNYAMEESYWATASLKFTKWAKAMRQFGKPQLFAFLFVTWFMGLGVGQVFTFLFWHMQELNGSPTLFGVATVINHISEIFMFAFSRQIIEKIGHLNVLYLGLLGNVVRFLYVSWIKNPWWILPFEFLQGLTHAGVWVACCSYITQAFPADLRPITQGFLKGVHYGLGRGLGACFGGLVVGSYGSSTMFRSYGAASAVVLIAFLLLNYIMPIPATDSADTERADSTADALDNEAVSSYGNMNEHKPTVTFVAPFDTPEVTHEYYSQSDARSWSENEQRKGYRHKY